MITIEHTERFGIIFHLHRHIVDIVIADRCMGKYPLRHALETTQLACIELCMSALEKEILPILICKQKWPETSLGNNS